MDVDALEAKKSVVSRRFKQGRAIVVVGLVFGFAAATINYVDDPEKFGFVETLLTLTGIALFGSLVIWLMSKVRNVVIRALEN